MGVLSDLGASGVSSLSIVKHPMLAVHCQCRWPGYLTDQRNVDSLRERATVLMLRLDRIMAMCLNPPGDIVIVSESSVVEEFCFIMEALLVSDGFGCVCQCEKHRHLGCQLVIQPTIQIIGVGGVGALPLNSVTQGAVWSCVYISIKERKAVVCLPVCCEFGVVVGCSCRLGSHSVIPAL
jgi:hypothetical protein